MGRSQSSRERLFRLQLSETLGRNGSNSCPSFAYVMCVYNWRYMLCSLGQGGVVQDKLVTDRENILGHRLLGQVCEGGTSRLERPVSDRRPGKVERLVLAHQAAQQLTPFVTNAI